MHNRHLSAIRWHFREKRYKKIKEKLNVESRSGFILDLGGGATSFIAAFFPRPEKIIILDIDFNKVYNIRRKIKKIKTIVADGAMLPFADSSVDVVICNSVLEHVDAPESIASEIRRVSKEYFVQTPSGTFPVEMHTIPAIPFYNRIPWFWVRRYVCKLFRANFEYINSVNYLSERKLKSMFPESIVTYEYILGIKKSFYIYRFDKNIG